MELLPLYTLEGYRGTSSVDPNEIADYILAQTHKPGSFDIDHTTAEDTYLLADAPAAIDVLLDEALTELEKALPDIDAKVAGAVWYQVHETNVGIYPHLHGGTMAFVYWVKTPPKGGKFCYHPLGIPGPELFIEPKAGDYIFFPTHLLHGVKRNYDEEPRISLSCNVVLYPKIFNDKPKL